MMHCLFFTPGANPAHCLVLGIPLNIGHRIFLLLQHFDYKIISLVSLHIFPLSCVGWEDYMALNLRKNLRNLCQYWGWLGKSVGMLRASLRHGHQLSENLYRNWLFRSPPLKFSWFVKNYLVPLISLSLSPKLNSGYSTIATFPQT